MEGGGQGWRMDDGGEKPDGVVISHAGYSLIEVGVVLFYFFFPSHLHFLHFSIYCISDKDGV